MTLVHFNFSAISFLIVDDSHAMCTLLRQSLISFGAQFVFTAGSSGHALDYLKRPEIDVALIDYQLQEDDAMTGLDIVRAMRQLPPPVCRRPVLFLTAYSDRETVLAAKEAGVDAVITKPFSLDMLHTKLVDVLSHPRPFIISDGYSGPIWPDNQPDKALK